MLKRRPNFLVILADDLGFSDLGCYGSEIETPNIDALAANGLRFLNFHATAACNPTRSMLLSGTDNHIAGVGHMGFWNGPEGFRTMPGYEGFLHDRVAALPEVLQATGYHTIMSGKWHLGELGNTTEHIPATKGFDKSFSMLGGCHNHYAFEPQFEEKPKTEEKVPGYNLDLPTGDNPRSDEQLFGKFQPNMYSKKDLYIRDHETIDIPANFPETPEGFYSTSSFTTQLLDYLAERKQDVSLMEKPWFAYFPFTAPHWPLQSPRVVREKYRGQYDDGPAGLRARRLQRMEEMGIIPRNTEPHDFVNPLQRTEWDEMTPDERQKSARAMEAYAGMVDCLDQAVGRVIQRLKDDGELNNTFIVFMSDNGAEGAAYEASPILGGPMTSVINKYYDNSLNNIGEPNSFVWYGTHWAQAATAPSRLYKMFTTQGGIHVPCILHYPALQGSGTLPLGTTTSEFSTVMDIMPTILDLAGVAHPALGDERGQFLGRVVEPMRGRSWVQWLRNEDSMIHADGQVHGWELHGRAALRIGDWKMVYIELIEEAPPYGKGGWELFDLSKDPGEIHDLAESDPKQLEVMKQGWEEYVKQSMVIWAPQHPTEEEMDEMGDTRAWMKASGFPF